MHKPVNNRNQQHTSTKNHQKQIVLQHQHKNKAQEGSLLSLLRRNRSMNALQEHPGSYHKQRQSKIQQFRDQVDKKQASGGQTNDTKQQKIQRNNLKKLIGDQYLIIRSGYKHKKEKTEHIVVQTDNKKEHVKLSSSRQISDTKHSYDPNNYNWRKSHSKSQQKNKHIQSPKVIQPFRMAQSQYYPFENNRRKQIKDEVISQKQNQQQRPKSKASGGHGRSKSALSRPKVIKNIFEVMTPKAKRMSVSSTKSLFFTFGL